MLQLRDYQEQAIQDLFSYWEEGKGKAPVIVLPTGAGKSLVVASFCERVCKESPHVRIMVIVHSREIVKQNYDELLQNWPQANAGIYSAGLKSRDRSSQIIFAGIQSVYNKIYSFPKIDILIVDEGHCIPRSADTRYGQCLKALYLCNPRMVMFCLTATPYRLDSGSLISGKGAMFDGICHCTELKTLIERGYLVPVISTAGEKKIDLTNVHIRAGEYAQNELAVAASDPLLVKLAVEEIVKYGKDRKAWLIYCSGVDHSELVAAEVRKHGIECKVLTGNTPLEERDKIINDFKNGKLRCIANVGVLTVGFNAPITDLVSLLMSTTSAGRYVQIVGRGLRTYPGKQDLLLLDFGNNVLTHGVLDAIDPIKKNNIFNVAPNPPPMRECERCRAVFHAAIRKCPACGFEAELNDATASHGTEAYSGPVLASQQEPFLVDVKEMYCTRHHKPGKIDSLKMSFYDKLDKEFSVWVCLNHQGFAYDKATAMVKQMGGSARTVEEALKEWHLWRTPAQIQCKPEGKWTRVTGFAFPKGQSQQQKLGDVT
jgi:DNA repair protein RadD